MQNKNNETGRSMVEMLGVLAVMGVLSVVGVAGFKTAINKHRASELLSGASQRLVVALGQLIGNQNVSLAEFDKDNVRSGGVFMSDVNTNYNGEIGIKINNVNKRVCQEIVNSVSTETFLRGVSFTGKYANISATDCQEINNLTLFYNKDTSTKNYNTACQSNSDCYQGGLSSGYKCNTTLGICEITCGNNQTYVDGFGCCPNNALWNGGCCYNPISGNLSLKEVDGVETCCRGNYCCSEGEIYDSTTSTCIACESVTGVIRNEIFNNCGMCPNLVQVSKWLCAPACTDPDAVLVDGICKCPLERPLMSSSYSDPQCLPCDYNGQTGWEAPYGIRNNDIRFTGNYCNRANGGGYSRYCAPGTVGVNQGQTIILSDGSSYTETSFSCKSCSDVDISALQYQASCESCGGTWDGDSWDNGTCIP